MTGDTAPRVYGYRWVVLGVFAVLNALVQMNWITFAAVTGDASDFYGVSVLNIGLLSMMFMVVFIFISVPASWVIDTYGLRVGIGIGATLTGVFALMRGIFADEYSLVLLATVGLAVGQPFVMNAITKVGARWFAVDERATAASIPSLAQFIGIIVAMVLTPLLVSSRGMDGMLLIYGVVTALGGLAAILFIKERPPTPPSTIDAEERFAVFAGLRHIFRQRDMWILLGLFFVGLGMFNGISTWIEQIVAPRGFGPEEAGLIGGAMLVGGILGAGIISVWSDHARRRKPFLILALVGLLPGLIGLAFVDNFAVLAASAFVFGFFLMSAYPVGMQYSAEVSYPAPESTSQGLIILAGQIAGVLFIVGMDVFRDGPDASMTGSMVVFIILTIATIAVTSLFMRESPMIIAERDQA